MNSKELAILIAKFVRENKAKDIVILNVMKLTPITDYFVICTGLTNRHVQALAHDLQKEMNQHKIHIIGNEGYTAGSWAILDYDDVVVHIYIEATRKFYDLEDLWGDAEKLELPPESPA